MVELSEAHPPAIKGRSLGLFILVTVQILIGVIHALFGFWLISDSNTALLSGLKSEVIYSVYTVLFGLLTMIFASGLWLNRSWGWIGTVATGAFVSIADTLTLLNLPSVPGIPKSACLFEISYSIIVIAYLLRHKK